MDKNVSNTQVTVSTSQNAELWGFPSITKMNEIKTQQITTTRNAWPHTELQTLNNSASHGQSYVSILFIPVAHW